MIEVVIYRILYLFPWDFISTVAFLQAETTWDICPWPDSHFPQPDCSCRELNSPGTTGPSLGWDCRERRSFSLPLYCFPTPNSPGVTFPLMIPSPAVFNEAISQEDPSSQTKSMCSLDLGVKVIASDFSDKRKRWMNSGLSCIVLWVTKDLVWIENCVTCIICNAF